MLITGISIRGNVEAVVSLTRPEIQQKYIDINIFVNTNILKLMNNFICSKHKISIQHTHSESITRENSVFSTFFFAYAKVDFQICMNQFLHRHKLNFAYM